MCGADRCPGMPHGSDHESCRRCRWRRFRFGQSLPVALGDLGFDPSHGGIGLVVFPSGREPAWRFGELEQGRQQDDRNSTEREEDLVAEAGHHPRRDDRGHDESDGEDDLVQQDEAASFVRLGDLTDVGRRDGHLGSEPDPLDESERQEQHQRIGEGHTEAHHGVQRERDDDDVEATHSVCEPAPSERSDQHADAADGDHPRHACRGQVPLGDQNG